jgi:hypothetical protein
MIDSVVEVFRAACEELRTTRSMTTDALLGLERQDVTGENLSAQSVLIKQGTYGTHRCCRDLMVENPVCEACDRLTRASKVLEQLTGQTPVTCYAVHAFGIHLNEKIAVHVTIRRPKGYLESERVRAKTQELLLGTLVSVSKNTSTWMGIKVTA